MGWRQLPEFTACKTVLDQMGSRTKQPNPKPAPDASPLNQTQSRSSIRMNHVTSSPEAAVAHDEPETADEGELTNVEDVQEGHIHEAPVAHSSPVPQLLKTAEELMNRQKPSRAPGSQSQKTRELGV